VKKWHQKSRNNDRDPARELEAGAGEDQRRAFLGLSRFLPASREGACVSKITIIR
tara:strand:+ start:969 stop:1133 length:165 start_codon:yes stop_codon:yes gene_type:complete